MQETSGHSAYNPSEHSIDKNRLNEFSISLKRDFHKAGLANEMDDGVSCSDDDDDGSDKQEETIKKIPPPNGKKTKGRVKIKMEFIDNKLRRYTTFSKRKTGIMKKAYELSTLTGTQVMLLVASETGHVYTFATRKLQPMITSEAGKALIQTCLNSPDPLMHAGHLSDQRMSATGFEETELTYTINDEDCKIEGMPNKSQLPSGSESTNTQSPLQMSIPVSSLINSQLGKNNISMQLQKQHPGFTTILTPGLQNSNHNLNTSDSSGTTAITVISGSHGGGNSGASLPLMYQTSSGVVYAPTTTAVSDGVIFSLGQNSNLPFTQESRVSAGQQYITVPVSINPATHQGMMNQMNTKWSSDSQLFQCDDVASVTDLSKHELDLGHNVLCSIRREFDLEDLLESREQ